MDRVFVTEGATANRPFRRVLAISTRSHNSRACSKLLAASSAVTSCRRNAKAISQIWPCKFQSGKASAPIACKRRNKSWRMSRPSSPLSHNSSAKPRSLRRVNACVAASIQDQSVAPRGSWIQPGAVSSTVCDKSCRPCNCAAESRMD